MTTHTKTQLIVTTNPGLEDIVVAELETRFASHKMQAATYEAKPMGVEGRVLLETAEPLTSAWAVVQQMRSIHHVHRPIAYIHLPESDPLAFIERSLSETEIEEMTTATSFRVTSKRNGTHDFTSIDVARAAGSGLVERYQCKVDLTQFDTNVRVDINDDLCSIMVQLTQEPLDYRYNYAFRPRVALKSNVAFALLVMAGLEPDGVPLPEQMRQYAIPHDAANDEPLKLLDPFCGSGTILIEAGKCLPNVLLYGNDRYEKPVSWTRDNLGAVDLENRATLTQEDARDLNQYYPPASMDVIVTNPPFGAQLAQETNFYGLYTDFLQAAQEVIKPEGRIVMLVWKRTIFNRVVKRLGLEICHARVIDLGGLFPGLFVLKKSTT